MKTQTEQQLINLCEDWTREQVKQIAQLPPSGSYREYYRMRGDRTTVIGAFNPDRKENIAFLDFSRHFHRKGLNVPQIYLENLDQHIYLLEDLGDTTLFSYLMDTRKNGIFPHKVLDVYKRVLEELPRFQVEAGEDLNYQVCYPRDRFDKQSMLWDLNYFKYYFLKLAKVAFDEQELEDDFQTFTDYLLQTDCHYFLYRDFQSRNIMLYQNQPYFIDYQGGRRGALQYDVASLLYDAKADLPQQVRRELLDHYIGALSAFILLDEKSFLAYYYGYALIRLMQAMGSFGFRGFYEKKEHFLQSIPYAVKNLEWLLETVRLPIKVPMLINALNQVVDSEALKNIGRAASMLTVRINSFSYRRGIPIDEMGNGGGYVFDCRALQNPGRYAEYKDLSGQDAAVIEFFQREPDVENFLHSIYTLVDQTIENYQQRSFLNCMISFGCTSGQHRSVYCAEQLAQHLRQKFDVKVVVRHFEQEMKTA
ncbi:hypothetical protein U27_03505 [Candidatus Vecturithrix granuli]|uniref:Uncharacterized protein n=1 Tax=Vecturithrix granuli TaxID=1499967 RepID=A0A081BW38_VECG1|nr:hypothetical protein U27_03505 [Candidatus Vecturithrix granuli]